MEFKHPKYYKELRKLRNKLDQAISSKNRDGECERATGPGLNLLAGSSDPVHGQQPPLERGATSDKLEATSDKQQASSPKLRKFQATSSKRQA